VDEQEGSIDGTTHWHPLWRVPLAALSMQAYPAPAAGTFHADESLAVALLRSLPEWKDADLVRTRDSTKLADCDIVVDVRF
jgi:hypothetical protein